MSSRLIATSNYAEQDVASQSFDDISVKRANTLSGELARATARSADDDANAYPPVQNWHVGWNGHTRNSTSSGGARPLSADN